MIPSKTIADRALSVALHEMGHYVVARALGFRTGSVSVELLPLGGHHGEAEIILAEKIRTIPEHDLYLSRRILVLYAGGTAEALSGGRVDIERGLSIFENPQSGASRDHAKIRELTHALRNIRHLETNILDDVAVKKDLDSIEAGLVPRAIELVELNAAIIKELAEFLAGRITRIGEAVRLDAQYLEAQAPVKRIPTATP